MNKRRRYKAKAAILMLWESLVEAAWFWPIVVLEIADACRLPFAEQLLLRAERRAGL